MSQPDGKLGEDEASKFERTVADAAVLSLRERGVEPSRAESAEPAVEEPPLSPEGAEGTATMPAQAPGPTEGARTLLLPAAPRAVLSEGEASSTPGPIAPSASLSIDELGDAFPADDAGDPGPAVSAGSPTASGIAALGDAFAPLDADPQAASPDDEARRAAASRCGSSAGELASGREPPSDPASSSSAPLDALVAAIAESARAGAPSGALATESASLPSAIEDAWAEVDRDQSWRSMTGGQAGSGSRSASWRLGIGRQCTNVLRAGEASRTEPPALLACIVGADEGIELGLGSRPMMVGRSPSCDLVLTDRSVSREHARLYRRGEHYFVQDNGSGNGTFVNGARVTERRLASGDEVAFGQERFRFLEIGDVFKPADAATPRARRGAGGQSQPLLWYGLVSLLILLSALVVVLTIVYVRRQGSGSGEPDPARHFVDGRAAFEARQWSQAQAQFEILLAMEPTHPDGHRYLAVIEREKAYEKQLAAARASFGRGDLLQAYTQAAAIADSVYAMEARRLTKSIEVELDRRLALAREALEAGHSERALELLTVIDTIRPGRADITALLERARKPSPRRRREAAPSARSSPKRGGVSSDAPTVQQALRLFLAGEIGPALARLRDGGPGAEVLAANIQKFDQIYSSAIVEHRAKRAETAIRLLEQAKTLAREISAGASSVFKGEISRKLADMYYVRGIEATFAERWGEARSAFEAALSNEPDHGASRRKLDELGSRAQALLNEADALAATDRVQAKARYRLVLQLVPPSDGRYKKAQGRLDAMP